MHPCSHAVEVCVEQAIDFGTAVAARIGLAHWSQRFEGPTAGEELAPMFCAFVLGRPSAIEPAACLQLVASCRRLVAAAVLGTNEGQQLLYLW
jgi:hypothetical protein